MGDLDPVSTSIGELRADVRNLARSFDTHVEAENADRHEIRSTLDDIKTYLNRVDVLHARVDKIEPEVDLIKGVRAKLAALAVFAGGVFTLLIEGVKTFGHDFLAWLNRH